MFDVPDVEFIRSCGAVIYALVYCLLDLFCGECHCDCLFVCFKFDCVVECVFFLCG